MDPVRIREASDADYDAIWPIFRAVVAAGDTYAYDPATTYGEARALWMPPGRRTFVALLGERVAGTYVLRANAPGLGDHVANAGYMTDPGARGLGIAAAMCAHSLDMARADGFLAMQFNFVVATNAAAIALWKRMGFAIVGTLPQAFRHRELGFIDVHVMFRLL